MKTPTRKQELERLEEEFRLNVESSQSLWETFREVVGGKNFVSAVAKAVKRNKALISGQLRQLEKIGILSSSASGVKQTYEVIWETFTFYWASGQEVLPDTLGNLMDVMFSLDMTPTRLTVFYVPPEDLKYVHSKGNFKILDLLEPVIPKLAEIVRRVTETLVQRADITTFGDAFVHISLAISTGLPDKGAIDLSRIDTVLERQLVDVLYHPKVQYWLRCLKLAGLGGAHVVENFIFSMGKGVAG